MSPVFADSSGAVADKDLSRRVGLVESWGPPRFQLSVQVGGGKS
jgi:hypothetical protein